MYYKDIMELSKVKITFAVAFTTLTGYLVFEQQFNWGFLLPTLGIFLLACSSSVLNHLQEMKFDARMERTRLRPLAAGRVTKKQALTLAFLQGMAGGLILYFNVGYEALLLGLAAFFWYNIVYTYLKRHTPNAVIPGSIIGAIPPLVGWVAANGSLQDVRSWYLAFFFFIWQIPHFYLLVLKYNNEYKNAGYPVLTDIMNTKQIKTLVLFWVLITTVVATGFFFTGIINGIPSLFVLLISSLIIIYQFIKVFFISELAFSPGKYFMKINYYVLAVITVLIADQFIF